MNGTASRRKIYYSDELNDDFAGTHIESRKVGEDYPFVNRSRLWRTAALVVYRGIATPLVWLISKLTFGLRIRNRRAISSLKDKGFFLYGNHTNGMIDAFSPTLIAFPHRAHIITSPDAVSVRGIGQLVAMLGAIPLPGTLRAGRPFREAINERYGQGRAVAIYPEAHIWPYYTGVRPFPATSFAYPAKLHAPCIAFAATYRRRRVLRWLPPQMTITLSEPFTADPSLSEQAAKQYLRDCIYDFIKQTVNVPDNCAYYEYIRREQPLVNQYSAGGVVRDSQSVPEELNETVEAGGVHA